MFTTVYLYSYVFIQLDSIIINFVFFYLDNQSDNIIKKRKCIKRSNSDSDITYCYLFQKYSETDTVFNITGILLKAKKLKLIS